jgi:hypothetical protein
MSRNPKASKAPLFADNLTVSEWRERVDVISEQLGEHRATRVRLNEDTGPIGISLALGHEGSEAFAAEHQAKLDVVERNIRNCEAALAAAKAALEKAEASEDVDDNDSQIGEAQLIVAEIGELTSALDAILAAANNVACKYHEAYRTLSRYRSAHPEIGRHQALPPLFFTAAVGRDLQQLLGTPLAAPHQRHSVGETEQYRWSHFLGITTKASERRRRIEAAGDKAADIEASVFLARPELVIDADEPVAVIRRKCAMVDRLVVEQLDALGA